MKTVRPKIIIDTDPGQDDALALLIMLLSNKFDVLAVTTVAGNSTINNVTRNAQAILNLINAKPPIFSGEGAPLRRKLVTAVVHGKSGLAGFNTSKTAYTATNNAPEKIVEIVRANPGEVSILALGPLSNIARAFQLDTILPRKIKQLVIMGGAIEVPGNQNRVAEFNFAVDPEAADIVFRSTTPKTLIPLDLCNTVTLIPGNFMRMKNVPLRLALLPMMKQYVRDLRKHEGATGILVYDALAAYFFIHPRAFRVKSMNIIIETEGKHTFGMSIVEKRSHKRQRPNVQVATQLDTARFRADFFRILDHNLQNSNEK